MRKARGGQSIGIGAIWTGLFAGLLLVTARTAVAAADPMTQPLGIQVNDDRMTVSFAGAPQVYLQGAIDTGAPARFEALLKSGRIPRGADVYLNVVQGELGAALALGRLFRANGMTTHLGTQRPKKRSGHGGSPPAICSGPCVYAYLGGLFRWAPTGRDRVSVGSIATADQPAIDAYLKSMEVDLGWLASPASAAPPVTRWLTADQMLEHGLANNGRLPLLTKSWLLPPEPRLELQQQDRKGHHRLTLACQPGKVVLTAYEDVGITRARQIVANETRSYFEVNGEAVLVEPRGSAKAEGDALMITRDWPSNGLSRLLSSRAIGGWVGGRSEAFRYGFSFTLYPARDAISAFYNACWRAAPWTVKAAGSR